MTQTWIIMAAQLVEHHPSSGINTTVHSFETFKHRLAPSLVPPPDRQPWYPFQSRLEFEVAKLTLEAALNNKQTDQLIKICQQCAIRKQKFMFLNYQDIHNKWAAASHCITKFTKEVILVPYNGKLWDFDMHYQDLWDLATDLLGDHNLFPHFTFNAQHLSKFDGETFIHFVDELFTAQDFWDIQPLAFILYADKTKLSSFGTAKGYPVVTQIANLSMNIRNGRGIGSSYMVGWLPIVCLFVQMISSLASKSQTGQWHHCLNGFLVFLLMMYYYRCVMSLICGIMSLWPCPICLVPRDKLWDTSNSYSCQTSDESQAIVEKDEVLKEYGLRDVDNSLWAVQYTDVHRALSHDHMHNGGLWSHHLWVELQKYVVSLRRSKVSAINKMYNFKYPNQVMGVSFADSSMHKDISKQYIMEAGEENNKGWSFPKMHMIVHIFDDIEAKGTTRNYNTKPNEQMHGPLKNLHQCWTNFKDFAKQAGNIDADVDDPATDDPVPLDRSMHVKIGSMQALLTLEQIEMAHQGIDVAFISFCVKLNAFLNVFLLACNLPLPNGKRVQLLLSNTADANQVTKCQFLQVNYESLVDCPMFFNAPHFDCVFIQTEQKVILGHLIFLFQCLVGEDVFPLALIHPFNAPTGV
ncbi:hypothetical protein BDR06DRAFT_982466 [Suillus hirtellus]|nr:hypothetical protein BDR06DRAFT_982466 [Suillus hirtellus]